MMTVRSLLFAIMLAPVVLLHAPAVFAKQVDCLVADDSKTYIDGMCEFITTDKDGSFKLTSGSIEVILMSDPGAKSGRVSYSDSGSNDAPWVTDVQRDGACWKDKTLKVCAWAGSRPSGSKPSTNKQTTGTAQTALDTVQAFYKSYFAAFEKGDANTPDIAMSGAFKADIKKTERVCKGYDGPCGWGSDGLPYLNSQDPDPNLSYAASAISFKETKPNTIRVVLNVNPSTPDVAKNTIIFKMIKESGQWVANDILYPEDNGARLSTRQWLAEQRAEALKSRAEQTAPTPKDAQGKVVEDDAFRMGKGCPAVGTVKSPGPKNPTWKVTFVNKIASGVAATIYWLNPDGEPVETEIFDENGKAVIDTNDGQAYIVKDFEGNCYGGVHVIVPGQTQVVVQ